jgi:hypothetical protein
LRFVAADDAVYDDGDGADGFADDDGQVIVARAEVNDVDVDDAFDDEDGDVVGARRSGASGKTTFCSTPAGAPSTASSMPPSMMTKGTCSRLTGRGLLARPGHERAMPHSRKSPKPHDWLRRRDMGQACPGAERLQATSTLNASGSGIPSPDGEIQDPARGQLALFPGHAHGYVVVHAKL